MINTHNGVKESDINRINIDDYPAVKKHLDNFEPKLSKRVDQGDTPYNLRNCAYMEDFFRPKIVYNDIAQKLSFAIDEENLFFNNTVYFIVGNTNLKYLLLILNSPIIDWYYKKISAQLGEKAVRLFTIYMQKLPIPRADGLNDKLIDKIFDKIKANEPFKEEENQINQMIYELYGLSEDEINFIENSI